MIFKLIYTVGIKLRNPSLPDYLHFLKKSESFSKKELLQLQIEKCRELLVFANKHSIFYQEMFTKLNFDPKEFSEINDLKKLPITSKETLLTEKETIQSTYPFQKLFSSESSGTSGQPLSFLKNEEWDSHNRAAMYRGYSWYGIKPWDKNGYFWGYNISPKKAWKVELLDKLQNRFRLFSYTNREVERFANKLRGAKYLHGYSSMIYEVAKKVNTLDSHVAHKLTMIKGTSEKVYDSYQEEVKKAFGLNIINEYGAAESGLIAFECPEGNMHINMENVIVEVDNGEIIVTNLLSKSFPIIRYKLGDYVELADPEMTCKCGRSHSIIKSIMGRVGKKVIGKKEKYPSLSFYYVFKNLATNRNILLNYQAKQNSPGKVELKIEQDCLHFKPEIEKELYKYFKDDVCFDISFGKNLHNKEGKLKDFITTLD